MDKLFFKSKSVRDADSDGIFCWYTFFLAEGKRKTAIGEASLYVFDDYFYRSWHSQHDTLDSIDSDSNAIFSALIEIDSASHTGLPASILEACPVQPYGLVYLECITIKRAYRSRGYGARGLRLLIERHMNDELLMALCAKPIERRGRSKLEVSAGVARLMRFYSGFGFRRMNEETSDMFLPPVE